MVKRTVVWTNTAVIQRREILKYWIERNGTTLYAEKLIKLIAEQISVIHKNPYSFKSVNYPDTHVSVLGHFSVFYKITKTNHYCPIKYFRTTLKPMAPIDFNK
ncbi:MAG: type II toxin-antitoxin system RelE/ParE family toxin [Crocinitomicaceae bacterium]|nr:type II toxin-antitoxin system RelE/ParE family toxin [Crocinitomicaceae bacterium]